MDLSVTSHYKQEVKCFDEMPSIMFGSKLPPQSGVEVKCDDSKECVDAAVKTKVESPRDKDDVGTDNQQAAAGGPESLHNELWDLEQEDTNQEDRNSSSNEKVYSCSFCKFTSDDRRTLMEHYVAEHRNPDGFYECPYCVYQTKWRNTMRKHVHSVHLKLKKHCCPHCEYRSNKPYCIKKHVMSVHMGEKAYKCLYCDYRSSQNSCLKIHIESVHNKGQVYVCDQCDFQTTWKCNVARHVEAVHGVQNLKQFKCPYCSYSCKRQDLLESHIYTQHKEACDPSWLFV